MTPMTNIFFVDEDPSQCAEVLSDQHVRTQVAEVAAVLCASLVQSGAAAGPLLHGACGPDSVARMCAQDPATTWANQHWDHFMWLVFFGMAVIEEHDRRFGFLHPASATVFAAGNVGHLLHGSEPRVPATWPTTKASHEYITKYDFTSFNAYQNVLRDIYETWAEGDNCATWTNTFPPNWLSDVGEVLHTD
jgi:hypothetical protein